MANVARKAEAPPAERSVFGVIVDVAHAAQEAAAIESGSTSPTTGFSAGMPAMNSTQYATTANTKFANGPASSTRIRCQTGLRL